MKGFHTSSNEENLREAQPTSDRQGLQPTTMSQLQAFLPLPDSVRVGEAFSEGDCFFDSVAQALNITRSTNEYTSKSLRLLCLDYYRAHPQEVHQLNAQDRSSHMTESTLQGNYEHIQYTAEELSRDSRSEVPIWGRVNVEGVILCRSLNITLQAIELLVNPDSDQIVLRFEIITASGCQESRQSTILAAIQNTPTLFVSQESLHMVPILRKQIQHSNEAAGTNNSSEQTDDPLTSQLLTLQQQLKAGLEEQGLSLEDVLQEFEAKRKEADALAEKGKPNQRPLDALALLQPLVALHQQIQELETRIKSTQETPRSEYLSLLELEEKLEEGLKQEELTIAELLEEITRIQQEVNILSKNGKARAVERQRLVLEKLISLRALHEQIQTLGQQPDREALQKKIQQLGEKLATELADRDLTREELSPAISKKQSLIKQYTADNKLGLVRRRQASLDDLMSLMEMVTEIDQLKKALESDSPAARRFSTESFGRADLVNSPVSLTDEEESQATTTLVREPSVTDDEVSSEDALRAAEATLKKVKQTIPACAEKTLQCWLSYLVFLKEGRHDITVANETVHLQPDQISTHFSTLKDQLQQEGQLTSAMAAHLLTAQERIQRQDWGAAERAIKDVLKVVRPFDIQTTLALIKESDKAGEIVEGQDIVLLLGKTGSGKSTTIHFLAGSEIKTDAIGDLYAATIRNPALRAVTISGEACSETRYVTAVPINLTGVRQAADHRKKQVVLCDTPGFEDTSGPEVDVANIVGLIHSVQRAKTVKPMILASYRGLGDRLEGLQKLAHVLAAIMPDFRRYMDAFTFAFTKYPEAQKANVVAEIEKVIRRIEQEGLDESDPTYTSIIYAMRDQFQAGDGLFIEPLTQRHHELLRKLLLRQHISYPSELFQLAITTDARSAIKEQLLQHRNSILNALSRQDYEFVAFKLGELRDLQATLNETFISDTYRLCLDDITKHFQDITRTAMAALDRCTQEATPLNKEDITHYQEHIAHQARAKDLLHTHLLESDIDWNLLTNHISLSLRAIIQRLASEERDIDHLLVSDLDKLQYLESFLLKTDQSYHKACQRFNAQCGVYSSQAILAISNESFVEASDQMSKIEKLRTCLSEHLDVEQIDQEYQRSRDQLITRLQDQLAQAQRCLAQDPLKLKEVDFEVLQKSVMLFSSVLDTVTLHNHVDFIEIQQWKESLSQSIQQYLNRCCEKFNAPKQSGDFDQEYELVQHMERIRKIPGVAELTAEAYFSTLERLYGRIQESKRSCELMIGDLLSEKPTLPDIKALVTHLLHLKKTAWVNAYREGFHDVLMEHIESDIIRYLDTVAFRVSEAEMDLKNPADLIAMFSLIDRIRVLKAVGKVFPAVEEKADAIILTFNQRITDNFSAIEKMMSSREELNERRSGELQSLESIRNQYTDLDPSYRFLKEVGYSSLDELEQTLKDKRRELDILKKNLDRDKQEQQSKFNDLTALKAEYQAKLFQSPGYQKAESLLKQSGFNDFKDACEHKERAYRLLEENKALLRDKNAKQLEISNCLAYYRTLPSSTVSLFNRLSTQQSDFLQQQGYQSATEMEVLLNNTLPGEIQHLTKDIELLEQQAKQFDQVIEEYRVLSQPSQELIRILHDRQYSDIDSVHQDIEAITGESKLLEEKASAYIQQVQEALLTIESTRKQYEEQRLNTPEWQTVPEEVEVLLQQAGFSHFSALERAVQQARHQDRVVQHERQLGLTGRNRLNTLELEQAFAYLAVCKKRATSKQKATTLHQNLQTYLHSHGRDVSEQMKQSFEYVLETKQMGEGIDSEAVRRSMYQHGRLLLSHFRELSRIKEKHPMIYDCFEVTEEDSDMLSYWGQDYLAHHLFQEFNTRIAHSATADHSRTELVNHLHVAKALQPLDSFMEHSGAKFSDLVVQYERRVLEDISITPEAKREIEELHCDDLMKRMSHLNTQDISAHEEMQRRLSNAIETRIEQVRIKTFRLSKEMQPQELEQLVIQVEKLYEAHRSFSGGAHLQESAATKLIDFVGSPPDTIGTFSEAIAKRIQPFLDSLQDSIQASNFKTVFDKTDHLDRQIKPFLEPYFTEHVLTRIHALEEMSKNMLSTVEKSALGMKVGDKGEDYFSNPLQNVYDKLKPILLEEGYNPAYKESWDKIEQHALKQLRHLLEAAKEQPYLDVRNESLRLFERILRTLPEHMQEQLSSDLESTKLEMKQAKEAQELIMSSLVDRENTAEIAKKIHDYNHSKDTEFVTHLRGAVLEKVQLYRRSIIDGMRRPEGSTLEHDTLKRLLPYQADLGELIPQVEHLCTEVKESIAQSLEAALKRLHDAMNTTDRLPESVMNNVMESFRFIQQLTQFRYDTYANEAVANRIPSWFPEDFSKHIMDCLDNLQKFYSSNDTKYQGYMKAIQELNADSNLFQLNELMHCIAQWQEIQSKAKAFARECMRYDAFHQVSSRWSALEKCSSYSEKSQVLSEATLELKRELDAVVLLNEENEKKRNQFYERLGNTLKLLKNAKAIKDHVKPELIDLTVLEKECTDRLSGKVKELVEEAKSVMQRPEWGEGDCEKISILLVNLSALHEVVEEGLRLEIVRPAIRDIKNNIKTRVQRLEEGVKDAHYGIAECAPCLIALKTMADHITECSKDIERSITEILTQYQNTHQSHDSNPIAELRVHLDQDSTGVGSMITSEYDCFKGEGIFTFNTQTQSQDVSYVLSHLTGDSLEKGWFGKSVFTTSAAAALRRRYDEFERCYDRLVETHLKVRGKMVLDGLVGETKARAARIRREAQQFQTWSNSVKEQVPELVAHIFALWTLQGSRYYQEAKSSSAQERKSYLLRPHAAQVIAIFRMLGIVEKDNTLQGHLVRIGTGEGKSVTLGVASSLIALLGADVYCACYSEYLSVRDSNGFSDLFNALGISSQVRYGTFNQLCEGIINEGGDVRDRVTALITGRAVKKSQTMPTTTKRPKILLVDEVDVFFNEDFYGKIYTVIAQLKHPTIKALAEYIWKHRQSNIRLQALKNTAEYKQCCATFPKFQGLIEEAAKDMIADAKSFDSEPYQVDSDRIGYKEQDRVDYNRIVGYKTLFAYFYEHERNRISDSSLDAHIYIKVDSGYFSYAELPSHFQCIMGVSGTLQLSAEQKAVVGNPPYRIQGFTNVPSIFGQTNLAFSEVTDVYVERPEDFYGRLQKEIDDHLPGKRTAEPDRRAVLVFFETEQALKACLASPNIAPFKRRIAVMTEDITAAEKEKRVKSATSSGRITFCTRSYGRGTDFVCYAQSVYKDGGVHVIQTFLGSRSEETQIKGRAARRGQDGSYSLVLNQLELERFLIQPSEIQEARAQKELYRLLDTKREVFFNAQYQEMRNAINMAKALHEKSEAFLAHMATQDIQGMNELLVDFNEGVNEAVRPRTICLLDATYSMDHLLKKTKNTLRIMFERAHQILQEKGIQDSFEMQLVVYRNYNCNADQLMEHSGWSTKPQELCEFMEKHAVVAGGWGNEAIEIALWHVNRQAGDVSQSDTNEQQEADISQVILIGDAAANTPAEVKEKRASEYGERYWQQQTPYTQPTSYKHELKQLKRYKSPVPVHAFYVDARAQQNFSEIATETGGEARYLNVNAPEGAELLTDFVTEKILTSVGKRTGRSAELVKAYKEKFSRTYISAPLGGLSSPQSQAHAALAATSSSTDVNNNEGVNFHP